MKNIIAIIALSVLGYNINAQVTVTEVSTLPEKVSNNAVCEGFVDNVPYIFSFGGIDSSKVYSGIHLKSFRYNIQTGESIQIPDLPDTLGKVAAAASRINHIIYISGGYHVFQNGSELSSNKMHRYDIINNVFLKDAQDIPIPIDDHVQAVWRDSLIYIITGWSHTKNVPDIQIYNPFFNSWMEGTSTPDNDEYKSFGASGTIINDTIYYFGGASSSAGFKIQNQLRKGVINPTNPAQIEWSISTPDPDINGYRMAASSFGEKIYLIGGSNTTYNFDGIAYNGTGGVPPANRILYTVTDSIRWNVLPQSEIPMDLRGIANINDSIKYIAGGMGSNKAVTNKIYKIEFRNILLRNGHK